MPLNTDEMADLPPAARQEVGRAWNAYQRVMIARNELDIAKRELVSTLIRCRALHSIPGTKLARIIGVTRSLIQWWTDSYRESPEAALRREIAYPVDRSGWSRRKKNSQGPDRTAFVPGWGPDAARIEGIVRKLQDE